MKKLLSCRGTFHGRQAEIGNLQFPSGLIDEEIFWLKITMTYPSAMTIFDSIHELLEVPARDIFLQLAFIKDLREQLASSDKVHNDVKLA